MPICPTRHFFHFGNASFWWFHVFCMLDPNIFTFHRFMCARTKLQVSGTWRKICFANTVDCCEEVKIGSVKNKPKKTFFNHSPSYPWLVAAKRLGFKERWNARYSGIFLISTKINQGQTLME
mgnify:FL=1